MCPKQKQRSLPLGYRLSAVGSSTPRRGTWQALGLQTRGYSSPPSTTSHPSTFCQAGAFQALSFSGPTGPAGLWLAPSSRDNSQKRLHPRDQCGDSVCFALNKKNKTSKWLNFSSKLSSILCLHWFKMIFIMIILVMPPMGKSKQISPSARSPEICSFCFLFPSCHYPSSELAQHRAWIAKTSWSSLCLWSLSSFNSIWLPDSSSSSHGFLSHMSIPVDLHCFQKITVTNTLPGLQGSPQSGVVLCQSQWN